ncbi:MAG: D-alanyl-D-alanine carboxypeptidase [Victivallales bacterium]|jgi:D-alanyl-D-alanine carboxypeptidase|nr:D-alanyl-D-alanine carboxypeptidase [Victivallales bacterium]
MNKANQSRWKLLGGILIVIIVIHAIAISCIVSAQRSKRSETLIEMTPSESSTPAATAPKVQEQKKDKSGGFWSWLFGSGKKEQKTLEVIPVESVATTPKYRYKRTPSNPLFGKPFDFKYAKHGDFSEKEIPGSKGATSGIMVDLSTRKVLWEKNSSKQLPIASMVKMMTLFLAFEELEANPTLSLNSPVRISPEVLKVQRTGIIWLDPRETLPLSDLMKAATIKSANDAAVQIALFFSQGNIEEFITKMNAKALEMGMIGSNFVSPCGLPDKVKGNSLSTAQDMVILGERLLEEYPQYIKWSTTQLDYIRTGEKRTMLNATNKLVNPRYPGVDGLKTGYTDDAGYCLTFSVLRNGRRIVGCVTGFPSARRGRDPFCRKLIDWGYKRATELDKKP